MTCIYTNLKCFVNGMVDFFDHHLYWHARTAKGTMVWTGVSDRSVLDHGSCLNVMVPWASSTWTSLAQIPKHHVPSSRHVWLRHKEGSSSCLHFQAANPHRLHRWQSQGFQKWSSFSQQLLGWCCLSYLIGIIWWYRCLAVDVCHNKVFVDLVSLVGSQNMEIIATTVCSYSSCDSVILNAENLSGLVNQL